MIRRTLASRNQPWVFIAMMVFDLLVNAAAPKAMLQAHYDRMQFEPAVREALLPVKLLGTIGVVLGRRWPRLGVLTLSLFLVYFAIAIRYHRRVDDGVILTSPAVLYGGVAARALLADLRCCNTVGI